MTKFSSSFLILLFTALAACTSTVYFIEPSDEFEYYEDRKVITLEKDSLLLSLNFEELFDGTLYFLLYAENYGGKTETIAPENISMTLLEAENIDLAGHTYYAANPEEELEKLEIDEKMLERSYEVSTALNCLFATVGVVASIADDEEETDPIEEGGHWAEEMIRDHDEYKHNKESLRIAREFWKNEVLRRTVLNYGEETGGLILLPFIEEAKKLVVTVKTEDKIFKFYFNQSAEEI